QGGKAAKTSNDRLSGSARPRVRHRGAPSCGLSGSRQARRHGHDADAGPGAARGRTFQCSIRSGDAMAGARVAPGGASSPQAGPSLLPGAPIIRSCAKAPTGALLVMIFRGDLTPMAGFPLPRLGCLLVRSSQPVKMAATAAVMAAVALVAPP